MDCVKRDAVISLIEKRQKELCPVGRLSRHYVYGSDRDKFDAWDEIVDEIQAVPAVDPVEHGKWVNVLADFGDRRYGKCSECHAIREAENYCPVCGAKMDL